MSIQVGLRNTIVNWSLQQLYLNQFHLQKNREEVPSAVEASFKNQTHSPDNLFV